MGSLDTFMGDNDIYEFNSDGSGGALHLNEPSSDDLSGNTDGFDDTTRNFLNSNPGYNVVMWSWCWLEKDNTSINQYLTNMDQLEYEYPNVRFVYMTGHLEDSGEEGDLHYYNEIIRNFCIENNKTLYDFADIESYDPDDNYFLDRLALDNCTYDSNGNDILEFSDANWALEWQAGHVGIETYPNGGEWYSCSAAHSEALNGNIKAYAAWYIFAVLAGWDGIN